MSVQYLEIKSPKIIISNITFLLSKDSIKELPSISKLFALKYYPIISGDGPNNTPSIYKSIRSTNKFQKLITCKTTPMRLPSTTNSLPPSSTTESAMKP